MLSLDEVVEFLMHAEKIEFREDIDAEFHVHHPRYKAFSAMSGKVLDLGAGAGGLGQYLDWPKKLFGIEVYGSDLFAPESLPIGYKDYFSRGWQGLPTLALDGALCIHVIEHLDDWREMLPSLGTMLKSNSSIYIEWPSENSLHFPKASDVWEEFAKVRNGYSQQLLTTLNYLDDDTHLNEPPNIFDVVQALYPKRVIESGVIELETLGTELVAKGLKENDVSRVTMGVWARFGFAQFLQL
jgi:hypothetical protein